MSQGSKKIKSKNVKEEHPKQAPMKQGTMGKGLDKIQGKPESKKGRAVEKKQEHSSADGKEKPTFSKSVLEKKEIKKLIQKGKERGAISFDELNEGLGPEVNSLEEIENVIAVLAESDIEVIDDSSKSFPEMMPRDMDEEYEDEGTVEDESEFAEFA
jgi:RNA polymerase primary sigma factor